MAPLLSKKRKSDAIEEHDAVENTTPTGGQGRKKLKITQAQKQALIDNLQLEITERARHLRAHYALQSTDLRFRVERRINRIPISLRKTNMGDLLAKHTGTVTAKEIPGPPSATTRPLPLPPAKVEVQKTTAPRAKLPTFSKPTTSKPNKRRTSDIVILSDKENDPVEELHALSNPKNPRRTKNGATDRAVSRTAKKDAGNVLSPKSHNSRTLPRSPIKDIKEPNPPPTPSPIKTVSYIARPTSPLKPHSPLKSAASAATSAISASLHGMVEQAKRGGQATANLRRTASKDKVAKVGFKGKMGPPPRPGAVSAAASNSQLDRPISQASNHSLTSNVSSGTTVVTKKSKGLTGRGKAATTTTTLVGTKTSEFAAVAAKASAMKGANGSKGNGTNALGKKVVVAEPAVGRRVLRKRT